jgi:hypothetical protein
MGKRGGPEPKSQKLEAQGALLLMPSNPRSLRDVITPLFRFHKFHPTSYRILFILTMETLRSNIDPANAADATQYGTKLFIGEIADKVLECVGIMLNALNYAGIRWLTVMM